MTGRVQDKVAIITGAGASGPGWGNGKASAVLYAREGAKIFAVDLDKAAAASTTAIIEEEGGKAVASMIDQTTHPTGKVQIPMDFVRACVSLW